MAVPAFLNMIGPTELVIILVMVLIVFGAGRLPSVLGQLGAGVKAFKDGQKDESIDVTSSAQKSLPTDRMDHPSEAEELEREKARRTSASS
jgi:sec-independent protein translocase protein TatA